MNKRILLFLKIIHTLFWVFIIYIIGYIWYAGLFNKMTYFLWICIVIVNAEGAILIGNKGICPITRLAFNFCNDPKPGFDIYLPRWLAKYNIPIFTVVAIMGMILVLSRIIVGYYN